MPGGNKKITGKDNTNGFQKNPENINRSGANRKVSIKGELEKILQSDGSVTYSGDQIQEIGEENGVQFVKIKAPTQEVLANKMLTIAMGKPDKTNTLRAIIELLEQFDGKSNQPIDIKSSDSIPIFPDVGQKDDISKDDSNK
jgi:hypothetical protein